MKLAKDFLSKFQNLTPPDDAVRKAVAETIRSVVGAPIARADVTIRNGIAFVQCSSVAKSAIRVQRGKVLEELYREMPKARELVRDVR
jgi:hypothetical protein